MKPRIKKIKGGYSCSCYVRVPVNYRCDPRNPMCLITGFGGTPSDAYSRWFLNLPSQHMKLQIARANHRHVKGMLLQNATHLNPAMPTRGYEEDDNLTLFRRSLSRHPGLRLCLVFPALGLLSGLMGSAENHRIERAVLASLALGCLVWSMVAASAWTTRHQYKDK